jgi:hypothetical protein
MDAITRFDRREIKYLLHERQAAAVRAAISGRLLRDPHAGPQGRYPVISIYLDNAARDTYREHLLALPSRRKVRIRVYGRAGDHPHGLTFMEIKHKQAERTSKRRIALDLAEALDLAQGLPLDRPLGGMDAATLEELQGLIAEKQLRPACIVRYEREAWTGRGAEADLRLTIDSGLRARARGFAQVIPDDRDFDAPLLPDDLRVLELKVDHAVPAWLSNQLESLGCRPRACSKYQLAVEALGLQPGDAGRDMPSVWAPAGAASRQCCRSAGAGVG